MEDAERQLEQSNALREKLDELSWDEIVRTVNAVKEKKPLTTQYLMENATIDALTDFANAKVKKGVDEGFTSINGKFCQSLVTRMYESMIENTISVNSELAEVQEAIENTKLIEKIEGATDEQKEKILNIIKNVSHNNIMSQQLRDNDSNNKAKKLDNDTKKMVEDTKDDEVVSLITQIFPTINVYADKAEKMVENHGKQWKNVADSFGVSAKVEEGDKNGEVD